MSQNMSKPVKTPAFHVKIAGTGWDVNTPRHVFLLALTLSQIDSSMMSPYEPLGDAHHYPSIHFHRDLD